MKATKSIPKDMCQWHYRFLQSIPALKAAHCRNSPVHVPLERPVLLRSLHELSIWMSSRGESPPQSCYLNVVVWPARVITCYNKFYASSVWYKPLRRCLFTAWRSTHWSLPSTRKKKVDGEPIRCAMWPSIKNKEVRSTEPLFWGNQQYNWPTDI